MIYPIGLLVTPVVGDSYEDFIIISLIWLKRALCDNLSRCHIFK